MTEDDAYLLVYERLQNLAQTPDAMEYVALYLMDSSSEREYFPTDKVWRIAIGPGGESYDNIQKASWFQVDDIGYFFDAHWDEPKPAWGVFEDGKMVPIGKGLMIEADIKELNTTRTLK